MIEYSIISAIKANITDEVYINTDDVELAELMVSKYPKLKFFKRDTSLTGDKSSSDDFNYNFIKNKNPDVLMMVNPVCPLINEKMIINTFNYFEDHNYDTVISASKSQMQFLQRTTD